MPETIHPKPTANKAGYRKLTVTLPPSMYDWLVQESARRKVAGMANRSISAIVTERAVEYFAALSHERALQNSATQPQGGA